MMNLRSQTSMPIASAPRFILTGAPGSGKTSIIEYIEQETPIQVVSEAAVRVFTRRQGEGISTPWEDMVWMSNKIEEIQIKDMVKGPEKLSLWDRSLIDSFVYKQHYQKVMSPDRLLKIEEMRTKYLFNQHVLLIQLNPDLSNFSTTTVRTQNSAEALLLQQKFEESYIQLGFTVHHIPWGTLQKRAEVVLSTIEKCLQQPIIKEWSLLTIENEYPLQELKNFADGLNNEGGSLERYLNNKQVWANLCAVLDRPYEDGIEFHELSRRKKECGYTMKEQAVAHFNERQTNLAYAMVMHYYLSHAHEIAKKDSNEPLTINIHTFRKNDGSAHIELLKSMLTLVDPDFHLRPNVSVIFSYGTVPNIYDDPETLERFKKADIILTFSVIAGINREWPSGTLLIPNKWIPFSAQKLELYSNRTYHGQNHLAESIHHLVASENHLDIIQRINTKFHSLNTEKKDQQARSLTEYDFKRATLIELNDSIFNPSKMTSKTFKLIQS